jgi:hypothetical protein
MRMVPPVHPALSPTFSLSIHPLMNI